MITPGHDIIVPIKTITSASYLPLLIAFALIHILNHSSPSFGNGFLTSMFVETVGIPKILLNANFFRNRRIEARMAIDFDHECGRNISVWKYSRSSSLKMI
ncbi:uncharacterized protein FFC1_05812 [Fusarium fujikuroi]|nr:uncharacterized protein FFC1_05812 [Fusarium fujikuroi]